MHNSGMGEHQPRREGLAEVDLVFQHARQGRAIELEHQVANEADTGSLSISPRTRRDETQGSWGILRRRSAAPRFRPNLDAPADFLEHDGQPRPLGSEIHADVIIAAHVRDICAHARP